MNIIVAGCGKIGTVLIERLLEDGHDITAVDVEKTCIDSVANNYDIIGVCGNCADPDTLREASVESADVFIAATETDETNMVSAFFAKRMGAKHTIARIRRTEYNDGDISFIRKELELSRTINPEQAAARSIYNILKMPSASKIETFATRSLEMIEIKLRDNSPLSGLTLKQIREKHNGTYLICAVKRGETTTIPNGDFVLQSGDKTGIIAPHSELTKLLKKLGFINQKMSDVMILGGSRIACYLAKSLAATASVKILEQNKDRCVLLSKELPRCEIINSDGAHSEILAEEGLKDMDAFVALTGLDEENILMSVYANSLGVPKVVTKVNRNELAGMSELLGLDSIFSPGKLVADTVVSYVRALQDAPGGKVETLYKLMDDTAEALEFIASESFSASGRKLMETKFRSNILVAGIIRNGETIIPSGTDCIMPGDRVIIISARQGIKALSDILA